MVLPSVLAILRAAYDDAAERTHIFGIWAAWTGAAGAVGRLLAGMFVDVLSWRAIFVTSMATALGAAFLLQRDATTRAGERREPVPVGATTALVALLASAAYAPMEGARTGLKDALVLLAAAVVVACGVALVRNPRNRVLLPRSCSARAIAWRRMQPIVHCISACSDCRSC
jgi:DHA2 family methylenomycin A resistance protein-like MFS transporter